MPNSESCLKTPSLFLGVSKSSGRPGAQRRRVGCGPHGSSRGSGETAREFTRALSPRVEAWHSSADGHLAVSNVRRVERELSVRDRIAFAQLPKGKGISSPVGATNRPKTNQPVRQVFSWCGPRAGT